MKREDLIAKLKLVQPALSSNPIVPLLCQFWFTGEHLLAYNDNIALAVPLHTAFRGAVSERILPLLNASDFDEIELSEEDGILLVRSGGRVAFRLGLDKADFIFSMPSRSGHVVPDLSRMIDAIGRCLMSVGTDTSRPEYLGITLLAENGRTSLYSTNGATITRVRIGDMPVPRTILLAEFCRQLTGLYGDGGDCRLEIVVDGKPPYALFSAADGVLLYGRVLTASSPLDFSAIIDGLLPSSARALVPVPDEFDRAVERACIICDQDRGSTSITVANGMMSFHSRAGWGEAADEFPVSNHPQASIKVQPKHLRSAAGFAGILVRDSCVLMTKGSCLYLIAGLG